MIPAVSGAIPEINGSSSGARIALIARNSATRATIHKTTEPTLRPTVDCAICCAATPLFFAVFAASLVMILCSFFSAIIIHFVRGHYGTRGLIIL